MFLQQHGLLNSETPDLSELIGENRDRQAVFCSSEKCSKYGNRRGKLVLCGEFAHRTKICPDCKSGNYLVYDMIPPIQASKDRWGK